MVLPRPLKASRVSVRANISAGNIKDGLTIYIFPKSTSQEIRNGANLQ